MTDMDVVLRLLLVTVMAGAIGFERERHGRAAGFRTHILVGVGSCLVMLTGLYLLDELEGRTSVDPTRMAAQVVSGVGVLGAGTILRFRASIRGLTTAASLWAVSGIGLAAGAGFVSGALTATVIVLTTLFALSRWERRIRKDWYKALVIESRASGDDLAHIRQVLADYDVEIRDFALKRSTDPSTSLVELDLKLGSERDEDAIMADLSRLEGTRRAHWA